MGSPTADPDNRGCLALVTIYRGEGNFDNIGAVYTTPGNGPSRIMGSISLGGDTVDGNDHPDYVNVYNFRRGEANVGVVHPGITASELQRVSTADLSLLECSVLCADNEACYGFIYRGNGGNDECVLYGSGFTATDSFMYEMERDSALEVTVYQI